MQPASLTAAGLPVMRPDEVELVFVSQATLENGSLIRLHLTNMRLLAVHQAPPKAPGASVQPWCISHSLVSVVDTTASLFRNTGINIVLRDGKGCTLARKSLTLQIEIKIQLTGPQLESLFLQYNQAVQKFQKEELAQEKKTSEFSSSKAGVGGIMRSVTTKAKDADASMAEAFSDLSAMIEKAKEMVELAKRFEAQTARTQERNESEDEQFRGYMLSMGLVSPVSKRTAGNLFHQQLARQLSDFLEKPLGEKGGMMSLPDVYCLYNRARGTDLISPQDLLEAAQLTSALNLPITLRRFPSGVLVLQLTSQSDDALSARTRALAEKHGHVTALDVARLNSISLSLARDQLLLAETRGFICRDDSPEGLAFYPNLFISQASSPQ